MTRGFRSSASTSVGVARQYSGALGKVGNCQIGVSVNACSDEASCPLDWRLFIPEEWDEDSEFNQDRRAKAKLPEDVHHVEKWRLALEMIDELLGWGIKPPVILGDGAYGDITELRYGLEERELSYVVDVKGGTSAYREDVQPEQPDEAGPRPPAGAALPRGSLLAQAAGARGRQEGGGDGHLAGGHPRQDELPIPGAPGPPGEHRAAQRRHHNGEELPVRWLICEWPSKEPSRPSTGCPTSLPTRRSSGWSGWPSVERRFDPGWRCRCASGCWLVTTERPNDRRVVVGRFRPCPFRRPSMAGGRHPLAGSLQPRSSW